MSWRTIRAKACRSRTRRAINAPTASPNRRPGRGVARIGTLHERPTSLETRAACNHQDPSLPGIADYRESQPETKRRGKVAHSPWPGIFRAFLLTCPAKRSILAEYQGLWREGFHAGRMITRRHRRDHHAADRLSPGGAKIDRKTIRIKANENTSISQLASRMHFVGCSSATGLVVIGLGSSWRNIVHTSGRSSRDR